MASKKKMSGISKQSFDFEESDLGERNPYHGTLLNTPFFHMVLGRMLPTIKPIMASVYAIRWQLSRPLQTHLLPKWFPIIEVPGLRYLPFMTIGQVLLCIPLLVFILAGYYTGFVAGDTIQSGTYASYAMFSTFLTAQKSNSLVTLFFGIPFERLIPFHYSCGMTTILVTSFHLYAVYAFGVVPSNGKTSGNGRQLVSVSEYVLNGPNPNLIKFMFDGKLNITGTLLALAMFLMVATSLFPILRRKFFDVWFWNHIFLAACVVIFALLHNVTTILLIAAWWAADVVMRVVVMASCRYPTKATFRVIAHDIVRIRFPKPDAFQYNPGQFVQIAFPDINMLAFHPLSIASAPHEPNVTLYARALGGWTRQVLELAQEKEGEEVSILVEGPYGSIGLDIDDDNRYQMVVCVCGGIGVTHCQSIAKGILREQKCGRQLKQLRFVWAIRDFAMLDVMAPLENLDSKDIELGRYPTRSGRKSDRDSSTTRLSVQDFKPEPLKLVETDIFVSKTSKKAKKSARTNLQNDPRKIHFGRPDFNAIILDVREEAERQGVTHVAVFGCGPKAMVDSLQNVCRAHSKSACEFGSGGVTFDVHEEIFEF